LRVCWTGAVVFLTTGCLAVVFDVVVTVGFGVVVAGLLLSTFHPASTFF
jgi:hypothetical protein